MSKIKPIKIVFFTSIFLVFFACKEDNNLENNEIIYSNSEAFKVEEGVASSEMVISDALHLVQLALDEENVFSNNYYPIITKEKYISSQTGEYPMLITIDFGQDTSENFDHRFRNGKIISRVLSPWKDSLSNVSIHLEDYYLSSRTPYYIGSEKKFFISEANSNIKINVINKGLTQLDNEKYKTLEITIDSGLVENKLGYISFRSSRAVYYFEGFETLVYSDDKTRNIIHSSGNASDRKNTWSFYAENPNYTESGLPYFAFNRNCPWIVSGDIKINYENKSTNLKRNTLLNFGPSNQSSCENNANFSQGGTSIIISIP